MITTQAVVGVAVSKATLAVCHQVGAHIKHLEVANTPAGFRQLVRSGGASSLYVLEATGPYYLAVAYHLVAAGAQVAVRNPLVVKRFIQLHLGKGKSDRKDAQWLLRYGQQQVTPRWQPEEALLVECRQVEQVMELLIRQKTRVHNALEALQVQPVVSPVALAQLRQTLLHLEEQVPQLEAKLLTTVEARYPPEMQLRCSIPGIGRKMAAYLLLFAGGFTSFQNYRQLIAKAGLCPREFSSGTRVRGKVRISKMGGALIRSKLFRCSWSARRANSAFQARYDRLVAKGKNGKLALIAVCNKLLKQAYAIVTSGVPYQAEFNKKVGAPLAF
ncbi:MAG: IS110 family transposase [Janthinobacterium lividum]